MQEIIDSVIYPIIATLITLIFTIVLLLRTKTKGIDFNQLRYIFLFSISMILFNFLQVFDWTTAFENTPFNRPMGHKTLNIADEFICLAAIFFYLHFEGLVSIYPRMRRFVPMMLLFIPITVLNFLQILFPNENVNETISKLAILLAFGILFAVLLTIWALSRIYVIHAAKRTRFSAIIMGSSILNLGIAFASQKLIPDDINFQMFTANIYQLLLFAIAVSLLGVGYMFDPHLVYTNPFELQTVIVYDEAGLPIYH